VSEYFLNGISANKSPLSAINISSKAMIQLEKEMGK